MSVVLSFNETKAAQQAHRQKVFVSPEALVSSIRRQDRVALAVFCKCGAILFERLRVDYRR